MKQMDYENFAKAIAKAICAGEYLTIETASKGRVTAADAIEIISQYVNATGKPISEIPAEGYQKAIFYHHTHGDPIGVDGRSWSYYILPLWFGGEISDLVLEISGTDSDGDRKLILDDILVQ